MRICRALPVLLLGWGGVHGLAASQDPDRIAALEKRMDRLEEKLEQLLEALQARAEQDDPVAEQAAAVVREVDEVRRSLQGEPAEGQAEQVPEVSAQVVQSPPDYSAADQIEHVPYSGYMEMHVNHDGVNPTTLDFHRFVLLFGHGFGQRIRFWSEVELEHAFVEGGEASGEIELEQAYLDFLIDPRFNFRAGMVLTPVGIINERHEPPSFNGVERPFVDTVIIPTTWFGSGAGFVGDLGRGFSYKTYVMSSLDATQFSAEEGFAEGRQKGFFENARNLAWTGRLEYRGLPGLTLGSSFWTGETGFNFRDVNGRLKMFEFDGRYRYRILEGRGQFVITDLGDAARINRILQQRRGFNPNIAERMRGFYLEGGLRLPLPRLGHDVVPFYRYENFDTQFRMPSGFLPIPFFDRSAHVLGVTYYPYPDISFKFDYNILRSASEILQIPDRWNFGIGWWF